MQFLRLVALKYNFFSVKCIATVISNSASPNHPAQFHSTPLTCVYKTFKLLFSVAILELFCLDTDFVVLGSTSFVRPKSLYSVIFYNYARVLYV